MSPILGVIDSAKTGNLVTGSFESIQTITLGSAQLGVTFTGIPSTYTHLQVRGLVRTSTGTGFTSCWVRYNGDATSGNYAFHTFSASGSGTPTAGWEYPSTVNFIGNGGSAGSTSGLFGACIVTILDYSNTSKTKTTRSITGVDANGSGSVGVLSGRWSGTAAINEIFIRDSAALNFAAGTTFALYGIKG